MRGSVGLAVLVLAGACAAVPGSTSTLGDPLTPSTTTDTTAGNGSSTTTSLGPAIPVAVQPTPGVDRAEPVSGVPVGPLVSGLNGAGFDLWSIQPVDSNLVFSPSSIGHALLMARAAADAATGEAIDAAFGLPDGLAAHEAWNAVYHSIIDSAARAEPLHPEDDEDEEPVDEDVVVVMADKIWPDRSASPSQEWVDLLVSQHGAGVEVLDLQGNPAGSADAINAWIDEQTRGLIPTLATPSDVAGNVLILTDTVYFKASWLIAFPDFRTSPDTFTLHDGTTVEVPFMAHDKWGPQAAKGNGWVAAEIPYVGEEFSMLVVVPDQGRFSDVRDQLSNGLIGDIDSKLYTGNHQLFLPKWEMKTDIDLLPWLSEIGAAPGSYPGIDPAAFLGGAKHAAKIIVDELGTEAAAATMLAFPTSAGPPPDIIVRADKPFLYVVRHLPTGLILFAGQVNNPDNT